MSSSSLSFLIADANALMPQTPDVFLHSTLCYQEWCMIDVFVVVLVMQSGEDIDLVYVRCACYGTHCCDDDFSATPRKVLHAVLPRTVH